MAGKRFKTGDYFSIPFDAAQEAKVIGAGNIEDLLRIFKPRV